MRFYILEPEVAGGLGEKTLMDTTVHPPKVSQLHYEFSGWLGDDLLESFPCFIVTAPLRHRLEAARLSGISFASVQVTTSVEFKEMYAGTVLPQFFWAIIGGRRGQDDFALMDNGKLVVSEHALKVLRQGNLTHCGITAT